VTTGETTAGAVTPAPAGTDVRGPVDDWDRVVRWWDGAFVAIVALTAVALPLGGQAGRRLWVAYGAMAVLVAAYAALGARAARTRDQRRATAYVVVLVAATGVAVSQGGLATFLLFAAFTQIWMLLEPPARAVVASTVLAVVVTLGMAYEDGFDVPSLVEAAPQMGVALSFAVLLGMWTATTMRRSEEHARLVHELRAAQDALAATHHRAGVAAERERMAREIHDTLAQGFTSVVMQAQAATAALDRGETAAVRDRLGVVEATARENLAEARALVAAFAPLPLQDATLAEALRRLGDRFAAETGVAVRVEVAPGDGLAPASDVVLLRAAQEALANVRRHAGARSVVVRLARDDGAAELEVTDDGRGLPAGRAEGFGLSGMRERVASVGGTLDVGPGRAGGTTLRVRVPAVAS
jgi:signal transduction histidine kinase